MLWPHGVARTERAGPPRRRLVDGGGDGAARLACSPPTLTPLLWTSSGGAAAAVAMTRTEPARVMVPPRISFEQLSTARACRERSGPRGCTRTEGSPGIPRHWARGRPELVRQRHCLWQVAACLQCGGGREGGGREECCRAHCHWQAPFFVGAFVGVFVVGAARATGGRQCAAPGASATSIKRLVA